MCRGVATGGRVELLDGNGYGSEEVARAAKVVPWWVRTLTALADGPCGVCQTRWWGLEGLCTDALAGRVCCRGAGVDDGCAGRDKDEGCGWWKRGEGREDTACRWDLGNERASTGWETHARRGETRRERERGVNNFNLYPGIRIVSDSN